MHLHCAALSSSNKELPTAHKHTQPLTHASWNAHLHQAHHHIWIQRGSARSLDFSGGSFKPVGINRQENEKHQGSVTMQDFETCVQYSDQQVQLLSTHTEMHK
jgi:hypothetical protein